MKIALIGFMGAGKSTVGKLASKELGMEFVEMDESIVKHSNKQSVNQIFEDQGEIGFRELEIEVAKKLKHAKNVIISTGGGVVMNKIIIDYLKQNGVVVLLNTEFETIVHRIGNSKDRPLFKNIDSAKKLYDFRQTLYQHYADHSIQTDALSIDEVVTHLIKIINEHLGKN